jgi:hypothetical protein
MKKKQRQSHVLSSHGLDEATRAGRVRQGIEATQRLLLGMRRARPAVCEWLSRETYVLPPVVNIVYMMTFESKTVTGPLDLVRMAQFMPNTKYKPPNFAALTVRIWPATGMLYTGGKLVLIRTTCPAQALYYSHLFR